MFEILLLNTNVQNKGLFLLIMIFTQILSEHHIRIKIGH